MSDCIKSPVRRFPDFANILFLKTMVSGTKVYRKVILCDVHNALTMVCIVPSLNT